jgi:hypothetical protein
LDRPKRFQLHVVLPYKFEPREHPRIRRYLDAGWRIAGLQRLTDRDALVTLVETPKPASPEAPAAG